MKMKLGNGHLPLGKEIKKMKENWQIWIEKIRFAAEQVLPHSSLNFNKTDEDGEIIIRVVIEVDTLPRDRFMINNIVNEILRRAELPIYNPFHIILRSVDGENEIEISKPR